MDTTIRRIVVSLFVGLLVGQFLVGCTTLVSGNQLIPVKATDSHKFEMALKLPHDAPLLSHQTGSHPVRIYKVAFDGTLNDRTRTPLGERETIVAHIAKLVQADDYQPGVGMMSDVVDTQDAMTGASCVRTAEIARNKFFSQAQEWLRENPATEIRVFVTGFSRGAATARHFINIVTQEWGTKFGELNAPPPKRPRFYGLLYDTVATGQQDKLLLNLPVSVEYLVHFVAVDEPRTLLFSPTVDVDLNPLPTDPEFFGPGPKPPKRLNTIFLPGAHSDIGASYPEGIGDLYVILTEQFLYMMGLTNTNCWDVHYNPFLKGKHDSRGTLDKLFGSPSPNAAKDINRQPITVYMTPLSQQENAEMAKHLKELWIANAERMAGTLTAIRSTPMASVDLRRSGANIEMIGVSSEIDGASVQRTKVTDQLRLTFRLKAGNAKSDLILRQKVLNRIQPVGSRVSITYLESANSFSVAIFVDDVLADLIPMERGTETRFLPDRQHCVKRADGSSKNPIQVFVFRPDGTILVPPDSPPLHPH